MSKPVSEVTCEDCMVMMARYPDKYFDLAVVDTPYGIGFDGEVDTMVTNNASGKWANAKGKGYKRKEWDKEPPTKEYFKELFRVSRRQIIWGGNYFELPSSGGWIVWDKKRPEDFSLSQAELAWCSFGGRVAIFRYLWNGFQKESPETRFHPTQKPIALYNYCFSKFGKQEDKILDTHVGSQSSRIAAYQMGFDFYGTEIDAEYFEDGNERFNKECHGIYVRKDKTTFKQTPLFEL